MSDQIPSYCENEDCYRDPKYEVSWIEWYADWGDRIEEWLCDPCFRMLERGTGINHNELQHIPVKSNE